MIGVFDIGKTNKKLIIFNDDLEPILEDKIQIGDELRNGILCERAEDIASWMKSSLKSMSSKYPVKSICVSTHGAAIVYLEKGKLAMPAISYEHEIPPHIKKEFFEEFGSAWELYAVTGSPPLGQLQNVGIQVYWVSKQFPEIYSRVDEILFLPAYLTYELSGAHASEITSVGCHTYLWDLRNSKWSFIAERLGVDSRSPELRAVWEQVGKVEVNGSAIITPGIHDTNASVLPFAKLRREDLILVSTGTWCAYLNPTAEFKPRKEDLYRDVLYFVSAFGKPLKTARFRGGGEHDHYTDMIIKKFNTDPRSMTPRAEIINEIVGKCEDFILPGLVKEAGPFRREKPEILGSAFLKDPAHAYHLLNLYLAMTSYVSINLVSERKPAHIIIHGGFVKNNIYCSLLSTLFPDSQVTKSMFGEITSLGAAMCAKCALEDIKLEDIEIRLDEIEIPKLDVDIDKLFRYVDKFVELASSSKE